MENLTPIAYEAAAENFAALIEGLGGDANTLRFEYTDAEKLQAAVSETATCVYLVLLGGGDVDMSLVNQKLHISEPRTEKECYEYTHSFVVIKTEEDGLQCFQQYPGGMDSDKELFSINAGFFDDLSQLCAHSREGVQPKVFQRLFCGGTAPTALPVHDRMIMKGLGF